MKLAKVVMHFDDGSAQQLAGEPAQAWLDKVQGAYTLHQLRGGGMKVSPDPWEPVTLSTRRRMPDERRGHTYRFTLAKGTPDESKGYVAANTFEDGTLGEIFITLDRAGSILRAFADAVAVSTSMRLQRGETIEAIAEKFVRTRFEPAGATHNELVPNATSVLDFVFRVLLLRHGVKKVDPYAREAAK